MTNDHLKAVFDFNYNVPDYLSAGSKYLAGTCPGAYTLSRELLGNADITTACGPLTWHILKDANSFPYRIDSLHNADTPFVGANPRWNGFPWIAFDPQLSTVIQNRSPMPAYDFQKKGNLFPGDIIFSHIRVFSNPTNPDKQSFAHIFVVAGLQPDGTRLAISNMIQNIPARDCSIRQVSLYTPGDLKNGVINHEWNGGGYGKTGTYGFDILRWKWQTFRINALPIPYTVRLGDTLETIGFDWKVNPLDIAAANHLTPGAQLSPGQSLTLPPVKP